MMTMDMKDTPTRARSSCLVDPMNAKVIIKEIENQLVKLDPDNSSKYKANSKKAFG